MTELASLTWPDAEAALSKAALAILPTGSIEQHGPHMALETDIAVAAALAQRLADDLGELALLCPRFDYGLSEHHMRFPGTLTLRPETFSGVVLEIVESLAHWGVRRLLVVNGHGGNTDALRLVSRTARRDHGSLVAHLMWAQLGSDVIVSRVTSPTYGHACEIETSVAMELAPHVVFEDRVSAPVGRSRPDPLTDPPGARVDQAMPMDQWTADGALGDPRLADKRDGKAIVDVVYARALEYAQRFAKQAVLGKNGAGG